MWNRFVSLVFVVACGPPNPGKDTDGLGSGEDTDSTGLPADCKSGGPFADVGTGETTFLPLSDGADLMLVFGSQGGWHLTTAVQVSAASPLVSFHPTASTVDDGTHVSGDQVAEYRELVPYEQASCAGTATNLRVFLDGSDPVHACSLRDRLVEITMEVMDLQTDVAIFATRRVTVRGDPNDASTCP